jgi:photosystem II stability/assembly factor-like uncharacterized protein
VQSPILKLSAIHVCQCVLCLTNKQTGGYGIIDVAWKDDKETWAVGGGGNLWVSVDGGRYALKTEFVELSSLT